MFYLMESVYSWKMWETGLENNSLEFFEWVHTQLGAFVVFGEEILAQFL